MRAKKFEPPDMPTLYNLEVVVMPNGEVLSCGKSLGWVSKFGTALTKKEQGLNDVVDDIDPWEDYV
jgi:hypothetical protein